MVIRFYRISPAVTAACGAALVFYGFGGGFVSLNRVPALSLSLVFLAVVLVSLFRSMEPFLSAGDLRLVRYLSRLTVTLALGFCIGLAALDGERIREFAAPMPVERIQKLHLTMTRDLRLLPKGSLSGQAEVQFCEDSRGTRISSHGVINLLVSESQSSLRELAGQGSSLVVEGGFLPVQNEMATAFTIPTYYAERVEKITPVRGLQNLRFSVRKAILKSFQDEEWGGFAAALLLGVRDDLNPEVTDLYLKAGSSHVLALSGMHLGIIATLLAFLLRRPLGFRLSALVSLLSLFAYVSLVGFQPSLTRSLIMYMLIMSCYFRGIPGSLLPIISLSFLIQLFIDPLGMASLSAMLSYLALLGIILFSPLIADLMKGKIPQALTAALSSSLGAFSMTAPLVAGFFGVLYPIGIFMGAPLGLFASVMMIGSILFLMVDPLLPVLSSLLSEAMWQVYTIHVSVLQASSTISVELGGLNWKPVLLCSIATAAFFVYAQYRGKAKRIISAFD